ncbi:hypothetical protein ACTWP5_14535 [Streptomyces sp. 4N509B]|uniref:hypothetical protein n=1 Tax=Streptomyces sp. 4N509B TaxID=3457413 RepID=UPI003FD216A6
MGMRRDGTFGGRRGVMVGLALVLGLGVLVLVVLSAVPAGAAAPGGEVRSVRVPCESGRVAALNEAIVSANADASGTRWEIALEGGCTYTVSSPFGGVNGLTAVTGDVRLHAVGAGQATIRRSAVTGTPEFRVMEVEVGGRLALEDVVLTNGRAGSGAGVFNNFGTLTLTRVTLADNHAREIGGGLAHNGEQAATTARLSTIRDNTATFAGGGIFVNGGTVELVSSRVTGNEATEGVGGGALVNSRLSALRLTGSVVTDNAAGQAAGGIMNTGTVTATRSSVAGNEPDDCAGSTSPVPGCVTSSPTR